ncbi:MAG TPA: RNA-binding S4 domain-containing protein [Stellaceae bacterium]|jgi:ribosome-associated heat shock protein Hsp15|nr:RNA-binding S4 domain-containing protein [Stellaceae bacterium]
MIAAAPPERTRMRLDQWLWFARFAKSRSLAARLCAAGVVAINGREVSKANQAVRVGDLVVFPQGGLQRTVRVVALSVRRGPAAEAQTLYEEAAGATRLNAAPAGWLPLLDIGDDGNAAALRPGAGRPS